MTDWNAGPINIATVVSFFTGIAAAAVGAYIHFRLQERSKRERLSIVGNSIDFLASRCNVVAKNLYDNDGLAIIVRITVESRERPVQLYHCELEIKSGSKGKRKAVLLGTLSDSQKTVKIPSEETARISFVFDPSEHCKTLNDVIDFLTDAVYSLKLLNPQRKVIGRHGHERIERVRTLTNKTMYEVIMPAFEDPAEADRAVQALEASNIKGVRRRESLVDELIRSSASTGPV